MESVSKIEALAKTMVDEPTPSMIALCCRLLGSGLGRGRPAGGSGRLMVEEKFGHRAALRFDELELQLKAAGDLSNVSNLVAVLCELSDARGPHEQRRNLALRSVSLGSLKPPKTQAEVTEEMIIEKRKRDEEEERQRREAQEKPQQQRKVDDGALVENVLWCLQGIDGKAVYRSGETYFVDRGLAPKLAKVDLVRELCELGWLHRKVAMFTQQHQSKGLVDAALRSALSDELAEYYRLVAILEAQLAASRDDEEAVTLRRLAVWTLEPKERLKAMAGLCDATAGPHVRGGALLSVLDARAKHGDPGVRTFLTGLTARVAEPTFAALRRWLVAGDLAADPKNEFFVAENQRDSSSSYDYWKRKYKLRRAMIPSFLSEADAMRALTVGKTINFLRHKCKRSTVVSVENTAFQYGHEMTRVLRRVACQTNRDLLTALVDDFSLLDHLQALKACLLLTQGDFAVALVDRLAPPVKEEQDRHRKDQIIRHAAMRHDVWTAVDAAVRSSNASKLKTIDSLRVVPGALGGLDYEAPAPIDAVVDATALASYRKANAEFLKRAVVQAKLHGAWRHLRLAARGSLSFHRASVLHRAALARSRMAQLLAALEAHHFDRVDHAWRDLLPIHYDDLDALINAHSLYLDTILSTALFLRPQPPSSSSEDPDAPSSSSSGVVVSPETEAHAHAHDEAHLPALFDAALDRATAFCALVNTFVNDALGGSGDDDGSTQTIVLRIDATIHAFDDVVAKLRAIFATSTSESVTDLAAHFLATSAV